MIAEVQRDLKLSYSALASLARTASYRYKTYTIKKRDGGDRVIHHPSRALKAVQRWIAKNIVRRFAVHHAATAYHRGATILTNAARHAPYPYLLRMDLHEFFPSITQHDVTRFLLNPELAEILPPHEVSLVAQLVTRNGRLTIGAPSSPGIANAICYALDDELAAAIREAGGAEYTRYADDLFFSAARPEVLFRFERLVSAIVARCSLPAELRINPIKSRHMSRKHRRIVTGMVLTPEGRVGIERSMKRRLRACLHQFDALSQREKSWLAGMLAFVRDVDATSFAWLELHHTKQLVNQALRQKPSHVLEADPRLPGRLISYEDI